MRQSIRVHLRSSAAIASLLIGGLLLTGCEAPLHLEKVAAEQEQPTRRFDHFKGVARSGDTVAAVGDAGVVVVSTDGGGSFKRIDLPTRAAFQGIDSCPDGSFAALDTRHTVWTSGADPLKWTAHKIDTQETPFAVGCDLDGRIWVTASFSTVLISADGGKTWAATTQDEDMMITALQFLPGVTVAAGEFGTVMFTEDGGGYWDRAEPLPGEFYPMGLHFNDRQRGWVSGLSGTIYGTRDGGLSWEREETESKAPLYQFAVMGEGEGSRLFALGDNGTILEQANNRWVAVPEADSVRPFIAGAVALDTGKLLVAGGAGTLTTLDLNERVNALIGEQAVAAHIDAEGQSGERSHD